MKCFSNDSEVAQDCSDGTHCGTGVFMTPEILEMAYNTSDYEAMPGDIWSIGIVVYCLAFSALLASVPLLLVGMHWIQLRASRAGWFRFSGPLFCPSLISTLTQKPDSLTRVNSEGADEAVAALSQRKP